MRAAMQDRYVGDVGDFAKYALLRRLAGKLGEQPARLAVIWCLFPDETHNNDGRHISYLHSSDFEGLDDALLTTLRAIVRTRKRSVAAVGSSKLFPESTVFCDGVVSAPKTPRIAPDGRTQHRASWLNRCHNVTGTCDLVFFDPDNGLEIASVSKRHPNAGKYIFWDELIPFWRRGQTLLIYHHLNRTMDARRQVRALQDRFQERLDNAEAMPLVFRRGSCRIFWLVYRDSLFGSEVKRRATDFLISKWSNHFRPIGWPDRA